MSRIFALGALILIAFNQVAYASEHWICLQSANFELYTTDNEKTAREALHVFEQIRTAFTEILGVKLPGNKPVTIVAFRDEQEYAPYQIQPGVPAYYMARPTHGYIVTRDLLPEHYPLLLHEYTHVIINQAGMKLPLWLNEGFAELYGTMKPMGHRILVGRIIPARLQAAQGGLIDLHEILRADQRSSAYHESGRVAIFYAESWALVHMLKFSKGYAKDFDKFLDAIGRGQSSEEALQAVYGKSIEKIQADLDAYVHGDHFYEGVIQGKVAKSNTEPMLVPRDPLETAVMLAGIESQGPHRDAGIKAIEELTKTNRDKPLPFEALAWIQLGGHSPEAAIEPFHRALELGTKDANLCFAYAVKMRFLMPDADYLTALRRATEIDPGLSVAQKLLASYYFNHQNYSEAVERLHLVKKLERGQAFVYYQALSFAAFRIGNSEEAKSAASKAQEYALTPEDRRVANELAKYVNGGRQSLPSPKLEEDDLPR